MEADGDMEALDVSLSSGDSEISVDIVDDNDGLPDLLELAEGDNERL